MPKKHFEGQFAGEVFTFWGGRDTLHRDTALLIPAGMWVLVGEFLSIACSVQWASDWHQILVLFHPHCPILIFFELLAGAD